MRPAIRESWYPWIVVINGGKKVRPILPRSTYLTYILLHAGRRSIIGHGISTDGNGDVQSRLYDDSRESQPELRRRGSRQGLSEASVYGTRKWLDARHARDKPTCARRSTGLLWSTR